MDHWTRYPRVLVVGPGPFNYQTGFGITISNLFKGWPKDRLASLHFSGILPDYTVCERQYGIGVDGFGWPLLSKIHRKSGTGNTNREDSPANGEVALHADSNQRLPRTNRILSTLKEFLLSTGVGCLRRVRVNKELRTWVHDFEPEVIYCAVTDLSQIELVFSVRQIGASSVVTHAMDDWITASSANENVIQRILRTYTDMRLRRLYAQSAFRMAIGAEMSRVYRTRYGMEFLPFFNCPDADYWIGLGKRDWTAVKPFRFVFAGELYSRGNLGSLVRFAEAVELLNQRDNASCVLDVHSSQKGLELLKSKVMTFENVALHASNRNTGAVASLCGQADALLLTADFTGDCHSVLHLSMPTRLPPFLLSGTPIFAFMPPDTAMALYFREHTTAYLVEHWTDTVTVAEEIVKFMENLNLRKNIGTRGRQMAAEHFSGAVVRPRFREVLASAACRSRKSV